MSLLFDALNRAQDNGNKDNANRASGEPTGAAKSLQMPDASLRLPSGAYESKPVAGAEAARTLLSTGSAPRLLPYAAGGIILLAGVAGWFFYQQNQYSHVTPLQSATAQATASPSLAAPNLAASQVVAASGVAESGSTQKLALAVTTTGAATSGTTGGTDSSAKTTRPWTRPVKANHPHAKQHPTRRKSTGHSVLASTRRDPLQEGYRALSEGRLNQAEQSYQEALAQHPHEKDALLGLAVIAQRRMQTQRATDLYQQVLREDLGNVTAAAGLVSLSVQADPVAAESQLRQLLDIKPNAAEFHHALGNVLARQQRWGEAQQAFFRAYSLSPGNARYAYNLAIALDHLHQPTAALSYYEKAAGLAERNDPTLDQSVIGHRMQELSQLNRVQ